MTAGIFITHIPYKGTGPQLTDLLAGRLDAASVGASAILQHIKAGKLRCIATGSTQRLAQLPDVPTAEQGFPGFEMTQWHGMLAPATMAQANVDKLAAETQKAMKAQAALERLNQDAAQAIGGTPAQFAQFIAQEQKRWKQVVERWIGRRNVPRRPTAAAAFSAAACRSRCAAGRRIRSRAGT